MASEAIKSDESAVPSRDIEVLVPPGAMVESLLQEMDEGEVLKHFNELLRQGHNGLLDYIKRSMDTKAKVVVTLKVEISCYEGNLELIEQKAKFKTDIPSLTRTSIVKSKGGKMLCQPIGSSQHHPEQQAFFDARGNVLSAILVDRKTGEEIKSVAGRIGPPASQA